MTHQIPPPSKTVQSSLKGSSLRDLAERREDIIEQQRQLVSEKRWLEEAVVRQLFKEGREDLLTVNWNKMKRIG